MLSINKIYCWLFVFALLIQIPSIHLMKFLDELLVFFMMCLAFLDVIINKQYKKYKLLWIVMGIMTFYAIYSLTWVSYNTPKAVLYDFIAQLKPYCYFCVGYAIVPNLSGIQKQILKYISILNGFVSLILFVTGLYKIIFMHISYVGLVAVSSFLVYLLSTMKTDESLSVKNLIVAVCILSVGLLCARAKFYGIFIISVYVLFLYRPGLLKKITLSQVIIFIVILSLVLVASWHKIDYYFISGGQDFQMFNDEMMASFARVALYGGMIMILLLYPIFGSGLASFATNASSTSVNYSQIYYELGLDNVWGLSPNYDSFICDAFYPSLAQFGIVGISLFIWFFVWIYKILSISLYLKGKIPFVIGIIAVVVILIESIAATTFCQSVGGLCMMILGCLASKYKNITKEQETEIKKMPYKEKGALDYIRK